MTDYSRQFERFLREQKKLSPGTFASYMGDFHQLDAFARREGISDLSRVMPGDLNAFIRYLSGQNKASSTVNRCIASIRCFYQALQYYGVIQENPAQWIHGQGAATGKAARLSREEKEILLRQPDCSHVRGLRDYAMLRLVVAQGIRITELMAFDCWDYRFGERRLVRARRSYELPADVASDLENYVRRRDELKKDSAEQALFLNQYGTRMSRQGFWKQVKGYAVSAGLPQDATLRMLCPGAIRPETDQN